MTPTLKGRYRVTVRYRYDRTDYVLRCSKWCASHGAPYAAWNRCSPGLLEASAEFTLR